MNFIHLLTKFEADTKDLLDHVDDLAKLRMNGREIRNIVSTATQLALYQRERLSYVHLERCIEVAAEFEAYLNQLHGRNHSAVEEKEDWVR
jgi:DNA-binding ferritin-like protein